MKEYNVIRKSDGVVFYTYKSDAPIEWQGMEFTVADHVEVTEPVTPPVELQPVKITRLAFRNRFTMPEKIKLELASVDDPNATLDKRQMSALLRAYLDDVNASTFIDLNRPDTRAGVMALETYGILAQGRALEILNTSPTLEEIWNG